MEQQDLTLNHVAAGNSVGLQLSPLNPGMDRPLDGMIGRKLLYLAHFMAACWAL